MVSSLYFFQYRYILLEIFSPLKGQVEPGRCMRMHALDVHKPGIPSQGHKKLHGVPFGNNCRHTDLNRHFYLQCALCQSGSTYYKFERHWFVAAWNQAHDLSMSGQTH